MIWWANRHFEVYITLVLRGYHRKGHTAQLEVRQQRSSAAEGGVLKLQQQNKNDVRLMIKTH